MNASDKKRDEAANIGSLVHNSIDTSTKLTDFTGLSPEDRNSYLSCMNAYDTWRKEHDVQAILREYTVYSPTLCYAGTLDLLAEINGVLTLVDFKTSNAIYYEHELQLAAYMIPLMDVYGDEIELAICRLDKTSGDYQFKNVKKKQRKAIAFKALLAYYYLAADRKLNNKRALEYKKYST